MDKDARNIIWPPNVIEKIKGFRSPRFTPKETLDFITQIVLETDGLLLNNFNRKTYIEESGNIKESQGL